MRWSGYSRHPRDEALHRIFVPRVRCRRRGRTAALLPWFVTPYRWDGVDVIGQALELSVAGQGVRRIAVALGRTSVAAMSSRSGSPNWPFRTSDRATETDTATWDLGCILQEGDATF